MLCPHCNHEFHASSPLQVYCDRRCRGRAASKRARTYKDDAASPFKGDADFYKHLVKAPGADAPLRRTKDKTGQSFGRLVVTGPAPARLKASKRSDSGGARWVTYWRVKCACGNERDVPGTSLVSGKTTSCGCLRLERLANPDPFERVFRNWGDGVRRLRPGTEIAITRGEFEALYLGSCFYCGDPPSISIKHARGLKRNTIDRVNSDLGYTVGNCVSCCDTCNRMKRDFTLSLFIEKAMKISKLHSHGSPT